MSKRVTFAHVFLLTGQSSLSSPVISGPCLSQVVLRLFLECPAAGAEIQFIPNAPQFLSIIKCKKGSKMHAIWTKKTTSEFRYF